MQIRTFASGSSGNCALISGGGKYILLDAGISLKRIRQCLAQLGLGLEDVSAVFLTHEHSDHVAALPMLEKLTDIPVYTSGGTARSLLARGKLSGKNFRPIREEETVEIGAVAVRGFETPHDAAQSMGFTFAYAGEKVAAVTDLGHVTSAVRKAVCGASSVLLEANHDVAMLRCGPYHYRLQTRILGPSGHLSNAAAGEFALELARNGARQILLAHLSKENNTPQLAYRTVADTLLEGGVRPDDIRLYTAPAGEMSAALEIGIC